MYIAAFAILRNQADAEEAAQETLVKAMTHLDQLSDPTKFKGWLLQIATNEARLKRRSRHDALFDSLDEMQQGLEDGFMPHDFADCVTFLRKLWSAKRSGKPWLGRFINCRNLSLNFSSCVTLKN